MQTAHRLYQHQLHNLVLLLFISEPNKRVLSETKSEGDPTSVPQKPKLSKAERHVPFRRLSVLPKLLRRRQVVNLFSLFYIIWLSQWIYTTNIKHLTPTSLSRKFEVKLYMKKRMRSFVLDKRALCYGSLFAFGIIQIQIQIQIQSSSPGPFAERNFMYVWNLQV